MATAVKNTPETTTTLFDRAAAISLVGVVYVIGSLGILIALPYLFWDVFKLDQFNIRNYIILAFFLLAAATGLIVLGIVLLGPRAAHGTRAGIFVGLVGLLAILLITRWASLWLEHWAFVDGMFSPTVGAFLTVAVGLGLLVAGGYFFLQPQCESFLQRIEDQGWFSVTAFKQQQGQRVRRGTIVGIMAIVGAGLWTAYGYGHGPLSRLPLNWQLSIPFTGRTEIDLASFDPDDFRLKKLCEKFKYTPPAADARATPTLVYVDRYALRDFNVELAQYVQIDDPGSAFQFARLEVVPKSKFEEVAEQVRSEGHREPTKIPLAAVGGVDKYSTILLLPLLPLTLGFLIAAVCAWMAWRIVNYPVFADFLIATEAELNKVSWEPRKRLVQNTIVVLVTVFLMAVYLFLMDLGWKELLSWHPIRVLQFQQQEQKDKDVANRPW